MRRTNSTCVIQMHIVTFDASGRIAQIRQSWDQGALLKQLDIIGKTGRNWPIRDSTEQLRIITQCLKNTGAITKALDTNEMTARSRGNSTNALRDPHASLHLMGTREELEQPPSASVVSPYAGTRPRQRSFKEILGEEEEAEAGEQSPTRGRSQSPSKAIAPKIGAGKNFKPSRLFDAQQEDDEGYGQERGRPGAADKVIAPKIGSGRNYGANRLFQGSGDVPSEPNTPGKGNTPEKFYRPNPKKYQHFDFADGSDPQDTPKPGVPLDKAPKSKHDSQWSFDDFVTPQKLAPTRTVSRRDERHWDTEGTAQEDEESTGVKPRRDAETHFDFLDDGPSQGGRPAGLPRGAMHNTGLHLYDPKVLKDDGSDEADPRALGTITNLKDRQKDFDHHFEYTDTPDEAPSHPQRIISDDRMKAVKMMEANWKSYDESPAQKENKPSADGEDRGIRIAGDGMGGPKGTNRDWLYGSEDTPKAVPGKKYGARGGASKPLWDS